MEHPAFRSKPFREAKLRIDAEDKGGALDNKLVQVIADAFEARLLVLSNPGLSINQVAHKEGRCRKQLTKLVSVSWLSPRIVEAIAADPAEGEQSHHAPRDSAAHRLGRSGSVARVSNLSAIHCIFLPRGRGTSRQRIGSISAALRPGQRSLSPTAQKFMAPNPRRTAPLSKHRVPEGEIMSAWLTVWCGREDSNFHGLSPTTTSTLRVYQFRHDRIIDRGQEAAPAG